MYDDSMLPGGLMVDNMIDGLPSFPPTFDEHASGNIYNVRVVLLFTACCGTAPKINIQTPPKSPHHQFTDDYTGACDTDPSAGPYHSGHLDSLLVPHAHYQKSMYTAIDCCYWLHASYPSDEFSR